MEAAGLKIIIANMDIKYDKNRELQRIVEMLKFLLTIDDEEIIKSTIESIIEMLEDVLSQT